MRVIGAVSKDLYDIIPENNENNKFNILKSKIEKDIIKSIIYSPNEIIKSSWYWNKLSLLLNEFITQDDYDNIQWCKELIDIFLDPNYKKDIDGYHYEEE